MELIVLVIFALILILLKAWLNPTNVENKDFPKEIPNKEIIDESFDPNPAQYRMVKNIAKTVADGLDKVFKNKSDGSDYLVSLEHWSVYCNDGYFLSDEFIIKGIWIELEKEMINNYYRNYGWYGDLSSLGKYLSYMNKYSFHVNEFSTYFHNRNKNIISVHCYYER